MGANELGCSSGDAGYIAVRGRMQLGENQAVMSCWALYSSLMQCSKKRMHAMPETQIMQPLTGRTDGEWCGEGNFLADPRSCPNKRQHIDMGPTTH